MPRPAIQPRLARSLHALLASLALGTISSAQVAADELYAGGFPLDGEPAFSALISTASGSSRFVSGLSSETRAVNAARIDRATGEIVITGLFTDGIGSAGALIEQAVDAQGVRSERVLSPGVATSAVRAFVQDDDGGWLTAGFDGVERRRRSDGCVTSRFDLPPRTWNALAIRATDERAWVASFGSGGEVWELDLPTRAMRLVARLADFGWPEEITGLWIHPTAPNAPLWITTLQARAPLLALDLANASLAPHVATPPHGLNAIEGTRGGRLYLLGSGETSSEIFELDLNAGTSRVLHSPPQAWSSAALARPAEAGELVVFPRELEIGAPSKLEFATYVPPGAPVALWIVRFRILGIEAPIGIPLLEGIAGPLGALRGSIDLGAGALDGLMPGDGMQWQSFWLDPTTLEPRFSAPRWTRAR